MKPRIIFRADGGTDVGMGHVVRSLALADMLSLEFSIVFVIQNPEESILSKIRDITENIVVLPATTDMVEDVSNFMVHLKQDDIVVLDGYYFVSDYQKKIKSAGNKLVVVDDLHAWHHFADVIINYADNIKSDAYSAEGYTKYCLGLDYILLRKEFFQNSRTQIKRSSVKKVLISMGAADIHNLTKKYSEALSEIDGIEEIHLLLGSVNKKADTFIGQINQFGNLKIVKHVDISAADLVKLIEQCDLAICPASTISLECCAVGIPLISGYTAENQKGILDGLISHQVAVDLGDLISVEKEIFETKVIEFSQVPEKLSKLLSNQKKMIDGKSPERLLKVFRLLSDTEITFRFANESDVDTYFNWANDPLVRKYSFNQNNIDYESHVKWFKAKLLSQDCYFYLFRKSEKKVGQVRIDKSGEEIVIGISVDVDFRGQSAGLEMLKLSCNDYLVKNPTAEIIAYIKKDNLSSYSTFIKAGFADEKTILYDGLPCTRLTLKSNQS